MPALVARASALIDLKRPAEAIDLLRQAVGQSPQNSSAWYEMARAELVRDRPNDALQALAKGLAVDPDNDYAHRLASIAFRALGRRPESVRAAREAVRLAPHSWRSHQRLAEALGRPRRRWPWRWRVLRGEAWHAAQRAVELAPTEPEPHCTVGHLLLAQRAPRRAEKAFREALRLDPNYARALNGLGMSRMGGGRYVAAVGDFGSAAAADPSLTFIAKNIRATVWTATTKILLGLLVLIFVCVPVEFSPAIVGRLVVVLGAIALALLGWRLRSRLPAGLRGHLIRLPSRDRWLGLTLALAALATGLAAAALIVGRPTAGILLGSALYTLMGAFLARRMGVSRHNRD